MTLSHQLGVGSATPPVDPMARHYDLVEAHHQFAGVTYFGQQTQLHAKLKSVELIEQAGLSEMLERTPVTLLEVEKMLFTEWVDA